MAVWENICSIDCHSLVPGNSFLNSNFLDIVERNLVTRTVVELGDAGTLMVARSKLRRYLACAALKRGSRANNRETVAGWILNSRATSAAVLSPFETILLISACC